MQPTTVILLVLALAAIVTAAAAIIISSKKKKPDRMFDGNTDKTEVIPEEEKAVEDGENSAESAENEDTVQAVPSEDGEEIQEDEEASDEEEIPEDELCLHCGERRRADGEEYCEKCKAQLIKTKIPFGAWIAGIFILVYGLFALAQSFLISAPAIQVAKGDRYASEGCWNAAYSEYSQVDSVADEINGIIGQSIPFNKAGCKVKLKRIMAVEKSYSPLEAASLIGSVFTANEDKFVQNNKYLKELNEYFTIFQNTYTEITNAGGDIMNDKTKLNEVKQAFGSVKNKEGIDPVLVDYFICSADAYLAPEDINMLRSDYEKLDASAGNSGKDYSWLYCNEYAKLLIKFGETDKAIELADRVINISKDNYNAYGTKLKAYIASGDKEKASAAVDEFAQYDVALEAEYTLKAILYRCNGEFDKLRELCTEAFEEYSIVPELHRQFAIGYLLQKDYDNAFEQAYLAEEGAYNLYSMGDNSGYTDELINTVYVCANLCKKYGKCNTENASMLDRIIESYSQEEVSTEAKAIVEGKLSPEKVFTEGVYDLL